MSSSLPRQPTIFASLMNPATLGLHREVEQRLSSEAANAAHAATGWVHDMIRQAYIAGVKDGFAQGVQAEAEQQEKAA